MNKAIDFLETHKEANLKDGCDYVEFFDAVTAIEIAIENCPYKKCWDELNGNLIQKFGNCIEILCVCEYFNELEKNILKQI